MSSHRRSSARSRVEVVEAPTPAEAELRCDMAAPNGACIEDGDVTPAKQVPEDDDALEMRIAALHAKLNAANRQIVILDHEIRALERLCERALRNNKYAFWDRITLKIGVFRGVKMMFHHYASVQLAELASLGDESSTAGSYTEGDRLLD